MNELQLPQDNRSPTATNKSTVTASLKSLRDIASNQAICDELNQTSSGRDRLRSIQDTIARVDAELETTPSISVALVGPSRHGKSTLLNALASTSVLPTSDVRPCTAAIVHMEWDESWGLEIAFVSKDQLVKDWQTAVSDAEDYLQRIMSLSLKNEEPDDPRYLQQTLARFIELLKIEAQQSPRQLVDAVRKGTIPPETARLLGQTVTRQVENAERLRNTLAKYLSTQDVYWTFVNSCIIRGPFPNWHNSLRLVDLPGTNDTNLERARITDSLRDSARAVAIVTSDSNLGIDIESWLRNSSVLANFLEARDGSYQRLLVLRTKFDSYHPEVIIDDDGLADTEEQELIAYRNAISVHKKEQADSFHHMLKEIAAPLLPIGETAEEQQVLESRMHRIDAIPVHFVSALAHESFEGRLQATRSQKKRLSEHFNDDPEATGVPALRDYFNELAKEFVDRFLYVELEQAVKKELDQLVRYFQQHRRLVEAELNGAGNSIRNLVGNAEKDIIPWVRTEIAKQANSFRDSAHNAGDKLRRKLNQISTVSDRRLKDKVEKWQCLAWNSLRSMARKVGAHTTGRGNHIDINHDICSVLVDELVLGWTTYRDEIVQGQISRLSSELTFELCRRLATLEKQVDNPDAKEAIEQVMEHLTALTNNQRDLLLKQVEGLISRLESIRQPALEIIERHMGPVYLSIANELGSGCQERMRRKLADGFTDRISGIRERIAEMIDEAIDELVEKCGCAIEDYGRDAAFRINESLQDVRKSLVLEHQQESRARLERIKRAALALPPPPVGSF